MNAKNTQKIQKTVKKSLDFETTLADIRRKKPLQNPKTIHLF